MLTHGHVMPCDAAPPDLIRRSHSSERHWGCLCFCRRQLVNWVFSKAGMRAHRWVRSDLLRPTPCVKIALKHEAHEARRNMTPTNNPRFGFL